MTRRKPIYLPLEGSPMCFHYPDKHGRMGELRGREEYSLTIKGKKHDYYTMIESNGCSKCDKAMERRTRAKVKKMEAA